MTHRTRGEQTEQQQFRFVIVSNRLPVDMVPREGESHLSDPPDWQPSPGGLVTAMEPVVRGLDCAWVGWPGNTHPGSEAHSGAHLAPGLAPFDYDGTRLIPLELDEHEVSRYYEGFANGTVWPLYHDVITGPLFHREWWDTYRSVNRRFAEEAARVVAPEGTVWVHDYQLQLVPALLRELRPDLRIGMFLHIPFPAHGIFSQLPWRTAVLQGMLGADVIGFQRVADAANFRSSVRRLLEFPSRASEIQVPARPGQPARTVLAQPFPVSIDTRAFSQLAARADVRSRAQQIRAELGDPETVLLGVDRLDYTKGIGHRLQAFSEALRDGDLAPGRVTLVQVASPSRERVEAYQLLRDEIEQTVSRINGEFGTIAHTPVVYLHQGYPKEEMAALYLAADVLVVTALRDGMNLVAKEYVACRNDELGVLILSEFTGASDELSRALRINPHDIDGVRAALTRAVALPESEQRKRMRALRRVVQERDGTRWAKAFLSALNSNRGLGKAGTALPEGSSVPPSAPAQEPATTAASESKSCGQRKRD